MLYVNTISKNSSASTYCRGTTSNANIRINGCLCRVSPFLSGQVSFNDVHDMNLCIHHRDIWKNNASSASTSWKRRWRRLPRPPPPTRHCFQSNSRASFVPDKFQCLSLPAGTAPATIAALVLQCRSAVRRAAQVAHTRLTSRTGTCRVTRESARLASGAPAGN